QGAAVRNASDQAFLFEFEQRQPDVPAMGLKQVAEILLHQPLPRLTPSQYYVLLDALGDDGRGGFSRARWHRQARFRRSDSRAFGRFSDHSLLDLDGMPEPRPGSRQS